MATCRHLPTEILPRSHSLTSANRTIKSATERIFLPGIRFFGFKLKINITSIALRSGVPYRPRRKDLKLCVSAKKSNGYYPPGLLLEKMEKPNWGVVLEFSLQPLPLLPTTRFIQTNSEVSNSNLPPSEGYTIYFHYLLFRYGEQNVRILKISYLFWKNLTYRKNWIWWLAEADSSVYRCGARAPTDWVWWGVWGRKRHLRGPQRFAHLWRDCRQQRQAGDRPESRKVEEDSKYNLRLGQLRSPMWSSVKSQLAFGSCQTRYNISSVLLYPVQAF